MSDGASAGACARLVREDGFRFSVTFGTEGAPVLVTDEPPPLGAGAGPDPSELLAAAAGTCLASSLVYCLRKARLDLAGLEGEVRTTTVRNEQGRLRIGGIHVRLAPTVSAEVRGKMSRCLEVFQSFCTVTESVRQGIPVSVTVETGPDPAGEAGAGTQDQAPPALVGDG